MGEQHEEIVPSESVVDVIRRKPKSSFSQIADAITEALEPEGIFGYLGEDDNTRRENLRRRFVEIGRVVHPDNNGADEKGVASAAYDLLCTRYGQARFLISHGDYDVTVNQPERYEPHAVRSPKSFPVHELPKGGGAPLLHVAAAGDGYAPVIDFCRTTGRC